MRDCATNRMRFETQTALALEAAFDGGRITSDGGLLWLAEDGRGVGSCARPSPSACRSGERGRDATPSLSLIRQRVFQIACGYEDQNDSDTLREDPLLKMVCGSLPESGADLASQPTISRLENAATRRSCHQIAEVLFELYLTEREKEGAPREGAPGLRRDRRSHPRRAGRLLLPRLLPPAHVPSAARLRWRERAPDHGALEGGQHPRLQLLGGLLEAHRGRV